MARRLGAVIKERDEHIGMWLAGFRGAVNVGQNRFLR